MKIVWTERATADLHSAFLYWSEKSSAAAAETMLERIFAAVEMLELHPMLGRPGRVRGTRELVILRTPFLVAYRARAESIEILALLHGARKWPASF